MNVTFTEDKSKLPTFVECPQNLTLKPGETAWFACKTSDTDHAKVDWYFLGDTNPRGIGFKDLAQYKKIVHHNTVSLEFICTYIIFVKFLGEIIIHCIKLILYI